MFANRSTVTGRRGCCLLLLLMLMLVGGVEQTSAQPHDLRCLIEAANSHEVLLFPYDHLQLFDSAELAEFLLVMPSQPKPFRTYDYHSLHWNTSYGFPQSADRFYPEAVYDTGMVGRVVAAGPVLGYHPAELARAGGHDDGYIYRGPHFIGVRGHLFDGGSAQGSDTLLRINAWYNVNAGQTYRDSSGTLITADTDRRFLYRSLVFTKADLMPKNSITADYTEYREAFGRVDFRREGMGGLIDTLVTAHGLELEVIYLGGEKLALHSLAVRDSIYHLLVAPDSAGDVYRQKIIRDVNTLMRSPLDHSTRQSLRNLHLTDESPAEQTAGSVHVRRMIHNFLYRTSPTNIYLPHNGSSTTATIPDRTDP